MSLDGFDCKKCDQPNTKDNMVMCGECMEWYHLSCAGVSPGVENRPWNCETCPPLAPAQTSKPNKGKNGKKAPTKKSTTSGQAPEEPTAAISKNDEINKDCKGTRASSATGAIPKNLLVRGAFSANGGSPKCSENPKRAGTAHGSIRSGAPSSRALAQMALERLKEKQDLEMQKIDNQRKEVEKEKERLRKEKELEEQENALTRKRLQMLEQFLEEKHGLEEQIAEDEAQSQRSSRSGTSLTRKWLADQQSRNRISY